jgi:hypothetical protein
MKLNEVFDSPWTSWQLENSPFGIEKIQPRYFAIFRKWGNKRIYLRGQGFTSRKQAHDYLVPMVEKYRSSIITDITA